MDLGLQSGIVEKSSNNNNEYSSFYYLLKGGTLNVKSNMHGENCMCM